LRGVAVVSVALFHLNKNLFPYGYLGVDIFFCHQWIYIYAETCSLS
jgi:peptidoglycan/LPS O-acetylase OafA/YrhL